MAWPRLPDTYFHSKRRIQVLILWCTFVTISCGIQLNYKVGKLIAAYIQYASVNKFICLLRILLTGMSSLRNRQTHQWDRQTPRTHALAQQDWYKLSLRNVESLSPARYMSFWAAESYTLPAFRRRRQRRGEWGESFGRPGEKFPLFSWLLEFRACVRACLKKRLDSSSRSSRQKLSKLSQSEGSAAQPASSKSVLFRPVRGVKLSCCCCCSTCRERYTQWQTQYYTRQVTFSSSQSVVF